MSRILEFFPQFNGCDSHTVILKVANIGGRYTAQFIKVDVNENYTGCLNPWIVLYTMPECAPQFRVDIFSRYIGFATFEG